MLMSVLFVVAEARRTILDRCEQIGVEQCMDFVEQDLGSAISVDHPLHYFAAWPDKDAARGKDYAFNLLCVVDCSLWACLFCFWHLVSVAIS